MLSYKDMPTVDPEHWFDQTQARGTGLSWSKMSIGYEDRTGTMGDQILYAEIPLSETSYYIPPACRCTFLRKCNQSRGQTVLMGKLSRL
jgi:hypothetical protein